MKDLIPFYVFFKVFAILIDNSSPKIVEANSFSLFIFFFIEASINANTPEPKTPKSSSKPVLEKNQPTIDKLFVTPVRKRKRPSAASPMITPSSNEGLFQLL